MDKEILLKWFEPEDRWAISILFRGGKLEDCVIGKLKYIYKGETHGNSIVDVYFDYIIFGYSIQDDTILIKNKKGDYIDTEADEELYWSLDKRFLYNNRKIAEKEFLKFLMNNKTTE